MSQCPRCATRKWPFPGDRPMCAFPNGSSSPDNWNCATMAILRDEAVARGTICIDDQHVGAVDGDGDEAIVLYWYKRRGCTESAVVVSDLGHRPLTLEYAEQAIGWIEGDSAGAKADGGGGR